jgi:hypothetical protein
VARGRRRGAPGEGRRRRAARRRRPVSYALAGSVGVASCRPSSFAAAAFERLGISLPAGEQAMCAPLRALYRAIGPAAAEWVQGTAGAAAIGAIHGPPARAPSAVATS